MTGTYISEPGRVERGKMTMANENVVWSVCADGFRFSVGDLVRHVAGRSVLLVVGRGVVECAEACLTREYLVSGFSSVGISRMRVVEIELVSADPRAQDVAQETAREGPVA